MSTVHKPPNWKAVYSVTCVTRSPVCGESFTQNKKILLKSHKFHFTKTVIYLPHFLADLGHRKPRSALFGYTPVTEEREQRAGGCYNKRYNTYYNILDST